MNAHAMERAGSLETFPSSRKRNTSTAVVIGAGIIGTTVALKLQLAGIRTVLVDRAEPGRACSYGNAAIIATSSVLPLARPQNLLKVPAWLLDPLGPLSIRPSDFAAVAPWLLRSIVNMTPANQRRSVRGLKLLLERAVPAWRALLDEIGRRPCMIELGMLEVVRDRRGLTALNRFTTHLEKEGVRLARLDAAEVGALEPCLRGRTAGGLLYADVAHVSEPYLLLCELLSAFVARGGTSEQEEVNAITFDDEGIEIHGSRRRRRAGHVVIAASHHSAALLAPFWRNVPIGVEHGYHVTLPNADRVTPLRPISFYLESFVATPLASGLRLGGTVELARLDAKPNWRRAEMLVELARRYFDGLNSDAATFWTGARPSFPDSLPAIGKIPSAPNTYYAFGHQHLGLTLAAITAECICAEIIGAPLPVDLSDYSLDRFGSPTRNASRKVSA